MVKNKLLWFTPIIALAIIFIFSLTLLPSVQPKPQNMPVALVNEDQGVQIPNDNKMNMGQTIVEMIYENSEGSNSDAVKWVEVNTEEEVKKGLNNQEYYAALIIPKDFSAKQASLRTSSPTSPEIQIYINQGMNTAASTMVGQLLNGLADNLNNNVRTQLIQEFERQGLTLTPQQALSLVAPITKEVTNVNEIGTHSANGNSPVSLFQPLWMGSLAAAALIFISISKIQATSLIEILLTKLKQILNGAGAALVIGFGLTWLAQGMVGFDIPYFMDTAIFLTITSFSFFLMISAVLTLLGLKGMPIFILMLFFGAPLLAMAPEMMSAFYRDWIYSWLPMRFMVEGLREVFFFGKEFSWSLVSALVWIAAVSTVVILTSALKAPSFKKKKQQKPAT